MATCYIIDMDRFCVLIVLNELYCLLMCMQWLYFNEMDQSHGYWIYCVNVSGNVHVCGRALRGQMFSHPLPTRLGDETTRMPLDLRLPHCGTRPKFAISPPNRVHALRIEAPQMRTQLA